MDLELKAQVERLTKRSELLSGVGASVAVAGSVAGAVTQNVTTSAAVDSLSSATASFASSVTGSMQSSKHSVTGTLTETRAKLEAVRSQLVALNARMDSYDRANPGRQDSSQAQAMEAEYAPLYDKFQKLQEVERAQSADPTQMDGSGSLEEVSAAQQQIELQMRALNQEADSSVLMNAPDDSPRKQAVNEQLDYLNSEYQRLDGLRRQKEEQRDLADASSKFDDSGQAAKNGKAGASPNPSKIAPIGAGSPAGNTPSASLAGDDAPPFNYASGPAAGDSGPVTTRGGDAVNASVDASTGKIDFIDITIYTSFALGVDAVGLIPVVGEVTSPLGILGFRLMFWLKGMGAKNMNWLMALTGVTEVIPVASEILPGCTAFVLAACLTQVLEDKVAQSVQAATQSSSATKLPLPQTTATLVAESTEDASNTQTSGAPSSSAQMSFSDSGSASPSDSLAGNNDIAAAISLDGAGGRFPSGNPTSPGRAPTDPEGATKG